MNTQTLAAIDIGSNSIKLVVLKAAASDSFTIIFKEKEAVRLGQETLRRKSLSPDAVKRATDSINRLRAIAENRGAEKIYAVATASIREAENAQEFIAHVLAKTGVKVEILSAIEEARLVGIAAWKDQILRERETFETLLNIDIGGGSTELSIVRDGAPEELFSMKIGAVGLTERFLRNEPLTVEEIRDLRKEIRFALERPARELAGINWQLSTATSGTALALSLALGAQSRQTDDDEKLPKILGEIHFEKLVTLNKSLAKLSAINRTKTFNLTTQRAEIIIAGGQILEGVMESLGINTIRPCEFALREGVLIDVLREMEEESMPALPDELSPRLRGTIALGRRFDFEETHALQVARLAENLFDQLAPIFNLTRHERTLLSAAAILHDIGYHIAHSEHHKHSLYLIRYSELTGFTEAERLVIANVARYHRGALPKEKHADFMQLNDEEKQIVWKLGSILRIADALDRGYENAVQDIKVTKRETGVHIEMMSDDDCIAELQAANSNKAEMFEVGFSCKLSFSRRALAATK